MKGRMGVLPDERCVLLSVEPSWSTLSLDMYRWRLASGLPVPPLHVQCTIVVPSPTAVHSTAHRHYSAIFRYPTVN